MCVLVALAMMPANMFALADKKPDADAIARIQNKLDDARLLQYGPSWEKIVEIEVQVGLRDPMTREPYRPPMPALPYFKTEESRSLYFKLLEKFAPGSRRGLC
jgi:hypothetical protein